MKILFIMLLLFLSHLNFCYAGKYYPQSITVQANNEFSNESSEFGEYDGKLIYDGSENSKENLVVTGMAFNPQYSGLSKKFDKSRYTITQVQDSGTIISSNTKQID
ncbi:MAG: hypothetical protein ACRY3E_05920 [Candidatus Lariskella arthropodorum]